MSGVKPHILVLNKKDLADLQMKPEMEAILRKQGYNHVLYTNGKDVKCPGVKQVGKHTERYKLYIRASVLPNVIL